MVIRTIIAIVLSCYAFWLTMRHNIHMFQLIGYKNDEHIRWLKKNARQQWLLGFGLIIGLLRTFLPSIFFDVIVYIVLILDILVYRAMRRLNTKKRLVFTPRVNRLVATIITVSVVIIVLAYVLLGFKTITGICLIVVSLQWGMDIIANIINHPMEAGINQHYINDAKRKLKEHKDLVIIGVTGSYGKTSMKYYLQTMLQEKYNVLVTPGNFNTPLGVTRTVREYLKSTHEVFICEMGARRVGEIKELCNLVHPKHGIITSVGPQHLETFGSIKNVQNTKFELAEAVRNTGKLFLNGDNEYIREKAREYENGICYYSDKKDNGYFATNIKVSSSGTEFSVVTPRGERENFQMKLIGIHNIINVIGAISVASEMGMTLSELKIPVRRLQPVEHRMQIREHGLVTIIDDAYNSNPIGSKAALETLSLFKGTRILITPGMVELGSQEYKYNYEFGTYAADHSDYVLLVGRRITEAIRKGVLDRGFDESRCIVFDHLDEAMTYAYAIKGNEHKYILLENDLPDNY